MIQSKASLLYEFEASDSGSKFITLSRNDVQWTGIRLETEQTLKTMRFIQELTMCKYVIETYACGVSIGCRPLPKIVNIHCCSFTHLGRASIGLHAHNVTLSYLG